jgi:hypothetical protein
MDVAGFSSRHGNGYFIWAHASGALCPGVGTGSCRIVAVRTVDKDSRPCRAVHALTSDFSSSRRRQ